MRATAEKHATFFGPHRGALRFLLVKDSNFKHEVSSRFKIEINELLTTDVYVDPKVVEFLWQRIEVLAQKEPSLWIDAGRLFQLRDLGELAWLIYYADNFQEALSALQKFFLIDELEIESEGDKTLVIFSVNETLNALKIQYFCAGFLVSMTGLGIPQNLIKKIFLPAWIAPEHENECKQSIDQALKQFHVPVVFSGDKIVFTLESRISTARLRTADASIHAFFRNRLEKREFPQEKSETWQSESEFVVKLRKSIKAGLKLSRIDAKNLSNNMGISVRTLERILALQNLTLRALKQQIQEETATELLQMGFRPKEVASQVGFSDVTAFSRAYCGWTGKPPSQIRR